MATFDPDKYHAAAATRRAAAAAKADAERTIKQARPILVEQIPLAVAAGIKPADIVRDTGMDKEEVRRIRLGLDRTGKPRAEATATS